MAYNKAKEEKKWRLWKEAEEKQLRNLGVTEDDIEQLRIGENEGNRCVKGTRTINLHIGKNAAVFL